MRESPTFFLVWVSDFFSLSSPRGLEMKRCHSYGRLIGELYEVIAFFCGRKCVFLFPSVVNLGVWWRYYSRNGTLEICSLDFNF